MRLQIVAGCHKNKAVKSASTALGLWLTPVSPFLSVAGTIFGTVTINIVEKLEIT